MLQLIHEAHFGIEKCKKRAREIMYWPGMSSDIETLVSQCVICETFKKANSKEPLKPHTVPYRPFEKIRVDIMDLGGLHSGAQRVNPEFRVGSNFRIIPEQYFSGVENVAEFLENIDNNLTYYGIPTQLACAYLKGHLTGRVLDWFEVLGYRVVEDKATDYAHLKQALSEQFPVVRNRSELETRFFASSQKHSQKPSDFVYDLLKIHKILRLEMTEEKVIDHIISRLEPQILDYVEVRHPQTTSNLLQIIDISMRKGFYIERSEVRVENPEIQTQARTIVSLTGIGRKIGGKREVTIDTRTIAVHGESSIDLRVKVLRIIGDSMVDVEVVNRIIDSTIKAVDKVVRGIVLSGDTGAEKSFISEEVYRKYFSYRPRQKTKDRVVTAQGAPCCHLGRVELHIRIQEFQKTWEFLILNNMQYQCILGIDFMKESKLTLDFDQKYLIIPDNQIKQLPKVEKPVEIDLSHTKLGEGQKQKLRNLFNGFKGLFSDQPGLTHVLYHEIDSGDKGHVVSRPYRYDRVKQGIIDYHIEKMLREGTIRPIQSPYASPQE
ncbi:uncharacterized protein TNCV_858191 [Trichonephila clavipes]|nr:uncharacterized protein TNCV_858191 [Trichonephila clavipes]